MILVLVESPFAAPTSEERAINIAYARAAMRDCLLRGEAPFASHLLYTQEGVLDDQLSAERELGIEAGLAWGKLALASAVYIDRGLSKGMKLGIERARREGRTVWERNLVPWGTKHCSCGLTWGASAWKELVYRGLQVTPADPAFGAEDKLELRDCTCGSTLSVSLCEIEAARPFIEGHVEAWLRSTKFFHP